MTISDVSDQDLSDWIAAKLDREVLPSFVSARNHANAVAMLNRSCYEPRNVGPDGSSGRYMYQPVARDMVNDNNMTVMLLEKLAESDVHVWSNPNGEWTCEPDSLHGDVIVSNKALGRAVAEAFALANGWPE